MAWDSHSHLGSGGHVRFDGAIPGPRRAKTVEDECPHQSVAHCYTWFRIATRGGGTCPILHPALGLGRHHAALDHPVERHTGDVRVRRVVKPVERLQPCVRRTGRVRQHPERQRARRAAEHRAVLEHVAAAVPQTRREPVQEAAFVVRRSARDGEQLRLERRGQFQGEEPAEQARGEIEPVRARVQLVHAGAELLSDWRCGVELEPDGVQVRPRVRVVRVERARLLELALRLEQVPLAMREVARAGCALRRSGHPRASRDPEPALPRGHPPRSGPRPATGVRS